MKRKWTTDISSTSGSFHLNFEAPTTATTTEDAPDAPPTTTPIQQPQHTEEINALTSLARSTQLPNWTIATNWLSEAPLSEWYGVTTHSETGRVTGLALPNNNLVGDMSGVVVAVSTLTKLTQLNLYNNSLCGCKTTGMLELVEQLVWFDYSGNEMTTFYRAPVAAETKDAVINAGILATSRQLCTTATTTATTTTKTTTATATTTAAATTTTTSSPLLAVNSTPRILDPSQCATIISLSEQYATSHGGWSTDRHSAYKTTDLDVRNVASLLDVCNACLKATILPTVCRLYELPSVHCLEVDDLFVVKYEWDEQGQHQISLPAHRDDSVLSFVIALNQDYEGGGTVFVDHRPVFVAAPTEVGTLVSFCGVQRHGGRAITQGIRYILAGFLNVHDEGGVLRKEAEVLYPLVEGEGLP
jgi:hypothetical protein